MALWKDFELNCTTHLNKNFGKYAGFIHQGGADSTVPDILVRAVSGHVFYIEAKHSPAQCGQFVLLPNTETHSFEYSKQNVSRINEWSETIITYMNKYFDEFREAGTSGKDISLENNQYIFSNWIIDYYKNKNVKFVITNDYNIVPIEKFSDYFEISAKYRIKKSGSSSLGKSKVATYAKFLSSDRAYNHYNITGVRIEGNKLFVSSNIELHKQRFKLRFIDKTSADKNCEYMFSARGNEYEVRKLSNTNNANVIFSIKLKNHIQGLSNEDFINRLR